MPAAPRSPAGGDRLFAYQHGPSRFPAAIAAPVTCRPGGGIPGEVAPPCIAPMQMPRSGGLHALPSRGGPHQAALTP